MTVILDASALLAFLQGETGGDVVEQAMLENTALCGAVNWSEVYQLLLVNGHDVDRVSEFLLGRKLIRVVSVTREDAEWAARRYVPREGLSMADRLCMALAHRLQSVALTADAAWGSGSLIQQIR